MNDPQPLPAPLRDHAARWTVRRDRGLSAAEAIEFELWLAADPRHAAAMARASGTWTRLDLVPDEIAQRALAAVTRRRLKRRRAFRLGLAAAAAAAIFFVFAWRPSADVVPPPPASAAALVAVGPRTLELADGTLVRLNAASELVEEFSVAERRVRLARGEAHFTVVRQPGRPFVVAARDARVRAVGTAFNVNLQAAQIEVLVTEGEVRIASDRIGDAAAPLVGAGERAVLPAAGAGERAKAPPIVVTRVEATEVRRALAWQDSLLRLGGATLAEVVAEFERRTGQRVRIQDPELGGLRLGGRLRADDVEGFANLLASALPIAVERADDGALVLRKKSLPSR